MPVPLFVVSHTVRGTCTVGFRDTDGATARTVTVPEGVYWTDPVYGTDVRTDYCLASKVFSLINTADASSDLAKTVVFAATSTATLDDQPYVEYGDLNYIAGPDLRITPSTSNAAGVEVLTRLGFNPSASTDINAAASAPVTVAHGYWWPRDRQERNTSWVERKDVIGSTLRGIGGYAWPYTLGDIGRSRTVVLEAVDRRWVDDEVGYANSGVEDVAGDLRDISCFNLMWRWAARGELVRVYSDVTATRTYITSAITSTSTSCVVDSATGITDGSVIWIDGEKVIVNGIAGTTLTLIRPFAVAHPAGSPVSTAHVATYALAQDGGNINASIYEPVRRGPAIPTYDMEISLVRATWEV